MFGLGWTEMLVIGVVALIVIGPKDLPVLMNRLGRTIATIRRMGSEFQRELNKATGIDQVTDIRRSITEPLKQTAADIRNEFNKPLANGGVEPSGLIKPADPNAESVVKEIHEKIGMPAPQPYVPFTKEARDKYLAEQQAEANGTVTPPAPVAATPAAVESPAPAEAVAPVKKPRAPRKPKTEIAAAEGAVEAPKPNAPRKPRKAKPPVDKPSEDKADG